MDKEKFLKTRFMIAYLLSGVFIAGVLTVVGFTVGENVGTAGAIKNARNNMQSLPPLRVADFIHQENEITTDKGTYLTIQKTASVFIVREDINKVEKWVRKNNFVSVDSHSGCDLFDIVTQKQECLNLGSTVGSATRKIEYYNADMDIDLDIFYTQSESTVVVVLSTQVFLGETKNFDRR